MTTKGENPVGRVDEDTIAAVATPAGSGGVGIVRVSGPDATRIVGEVVGKAALADRMLTYGVARDRQGERIDDVLAVVMRGPRSFTGEDVGEIHGHGGIVNMRRLLGAVLEAGAREAQAGEFTRRAFAHGRIDLTRAEAIAGVIEASSERAWRISQAQLEGRLGDRIRAARGQVVEVLAELEVQIDFPEEDVSVEGAGQLAAKAASVEAELEALAASFSAGKAIREGAEVALAGPVNAGKSSLLNALVGSERAIVAAEPGTTRDVVEARVEWDGIAVTLVDTAGERASGGEIERKGMEMGRRRAERADVELWVEPATEAQAAETPELGARQRLVLSKADLVAERPQVAGIVTSAETGEGLGELRRAVVEALTHQVKEADDGVVVTSDRQRRGIAGAAAALGRMRAQLTEGAPAEIAAIEANEASTKLAEVLGEDVGDEMLDDLFSRFCIGK